MKAVAKQIPHYSLLAATLVGIPLVCCVLGGKTDTLALVKAIAPVTEDWGSRHEMLWNCRCPFAWWAFIAMLAFVVVCLAPFVRRMWTNVLCGCRKQCMANRCFPAWGWGGFAVMMSGWVLSWTRFTWFAPFQRYPFVPLWFGFIVVMNALCFRRSGHSLLTDHPRLYLLSFPVSSAFWWFFEYLNRYVWNWYYVGVSGIGPIEYLFLSTLCFSCAKSAAHPGI